VPVTLHDRARLDALIAIVKPANSLSARIEYLNNAQREYYKRWSERWLRFIARHPDGEAYRMTLEDDCPQELPEEINMALFGPTTRIKLTDDLNVAMEKYRKVSL
jgi:hypothetical protein